MKRARYELVVGNIGVMPYTNKRKAFRDFREYVEISRNCSEHRAYGENVVLMDNYDILEEFVGSLQEVKQ